MSFITQAQIEDRAAAIWQRYQLTPGFDVESLLDHLGLSLLWEAIGDDSGRILGQLIPEQRIVVLNERHLDALEAKDGRLRRYTIGHEVGHWDLHAEAARTGALSLLSGGRTWCRDGSPDPVERQAERFSAALLIPSDQLRAALPKLLVGSSAAFRATWSIHTPSRDRYDNGLPSHQAANRREHPATRQQQSLRNNTKHQGQSHRRNISPARTTAVFVSHGRGLRLARLLAEAWLL